MQQVRNEACHGASYTTEGLLPPAVKLAKEKCSRSSMEEQMLAKHKGRSSSLLYCTKNAKVAQLNRAIPSEGIGYGFNSHPLHHFYGPIAQFW